MDYDHFLANYGAQADLGGHAPDVIAQANREVYERLMALGIDEDHPDFAGRLRGLFIVVLECSNAPGWRSEGTAAEGMV